MSNAELIKLYAPLNQATLAAMQALKAADLANGKDVPRAKAIRIVRATFNANLR
jgi:hypothetical protein